MCKVDCLERDIEDIVEVMVGESTEGRKRIYFNFNELLIATWPSSA